MSCDNTLSPRESKRLAIKLRNEDPEQFLTLVRMHLSFTLDVNDHLDLNGDESEEPPEKSKFRPLKWAPFSKKVKGPKGITEGQHCPLNTEVISQLRPLIHFLSKEDNLKQEGIFRRSGKVTRQQELKNLMAKGVQVKLDEGRFSVHDCATVLKTFLSELPEPLLTETYHQAYCQIAEVYGNAKWPADRTLRALQLLLLLLPAENRRLLREIIILLHSVASLENSNRMSAHNLATLFTPHLVCPRKLSAEGLHESARALTPLVELMITDGQGVFEVPPALATDIRAFWDAARSAQDNILEESVREGVGATARTVFSFVDRARSAAENEAHPTETALAQLYAHIQALPESAHKTRLVKRFNRENGHGTPRVGLSLKKHKIAKSQKDKRDLDTTGPVNCDAILNSPMLNKVRQKFRCGESRRRRRANSSQSSPQHPLDTASASEAESVTPLIENPSPATEESEVSPEESVSPPIEEVAKSSGVTESTAEVELADRWAGNGVPITSTPAAHITPPNHAQVSPITRSTQRMPRHMQEAMVTPRSRKPVVALSTSHLCQSGGSWASVLTETDEDLLLSPADLSFSSRAGDFEDPPVSPAPVSDVPGQPSSPKRPRLPSSVESSPSIMETSL